MNTSHPLEDAPDDSELDLFSGLFQNFAEFSGLAVTLRSLPEGRVLASEIRETAGAFQFLKCPEISEPFGKMREQLHRSVLEAEGGMIVSENEQGLAEGAVPMFLNGKRAASLGIGPAFLRSPDMDFHRDLASKYHLDVEPYLQEIRRVPVVSEGKFRIALAFLRNQAGFIAHQAESLRQSAHLSEQLGSFLSNVPGMAYQCEIDPPWRALFINRGSEELLGYSPEELTGNRGIPLANLILQEDVDTVAAKVCESVEADEAYDHEYRMRRKDGRVIWVHERGKAVRNAKGRPVHLYGVYVNITAAKKAEEEKSRLLASFRREALFREALLEAIPLPIFFKGTDERYLGCNSAFCAQTGVERNELIGRAAEEIWPEQFSRLYRSKDRELLEAGGAQLYEGHIRAHDGSVRNVIFSKSTFADESGAVAGLVGSFVDITGHALRERELRKAQREAETSAREKALFLANMSHEIRTPLNSIVGFSNLLAETPLDPEQSQFAEAIRSSSEALLAIINDILDLSKIEAGRVQIDSVEFDPAAICMAAMEMISSSTQEKALDFGFYASPRVPQNINGDPARFRQIITNLLANAVKFTERGHVEILLDTVENGRLPPCLQIRVRDTGIGIPPARQSSIFQAFQQGDHAMSGKIEGAGLGLAISKQLAEMLGGRLSFLSSPGTGSVFTLELPLSNRPAPRLPEPPPTTGCRAAIIDAAPSSAPLLTQALVDIGIDTRLFSTPSEFLAALDEGHRFDFVMADATLPSTCLRQIANRVRRIPNEPRPHLLLLAPMSTAEVPAHAGFDRILRKPLVPSALCGMLADITPTPTPSGSKQAPPDMAANFPLRILVAEDTLSNQQFLMALLRQLGYDAVLVSTGPQALEAVSQHPYDVLLLDLRIPGIDGVEVARRIHANIPPSARPSIVAVTAQVLQEDRKRCSEAGFEDFIAKPFRPSRLVQCLREIALRRRESMDFFQTDGPQE